MSETKNHSAQPIQPQVIFELPIEVSEQRKHDVNNFFSDVLTEHGNHVELNVLYKMGLRPTNAVVAEFTADDYKLSVSQLDGREEVQASIYKLEDHDRQDPKRSWKRLHTITSSEDGELTYQDGGIDFYIVSSGETESEKRESQRIRKPTGLKIGKTPPSQEYLTDTLDKFMAKSQEIITTSKQSKRRIKSIGKRILNSILPPTK